VLKGLQKGLSLPTEKMIPSFACLRDYGNTSCSTTWYSMAYIESQLGVKKNERVLQLGVGGEYLCYYAILETKGCITEGDT